jgi:hypothetical protein
MKIHIKIGRGFINNRLEFSLLTLVIMNLTNGVCSAQYSIDGVFTIKYFALLICFCLKVVIF